MTTAPLRKDAARNWQRIVEVGRRLVDQEVPIQLNDVARTASVGVATVYRHFPTADALIETLAANGLEELVRRAERAALSDDAWPALRDFLYAAIDAQLTDAAVAAVFSSPQPVLPSTGESVQRLGELFAELLGRARAAGAVDPSVTPGDLQPLLCGVVYAARVHAAADPEARADTARRYLDVLFDGLHTRPGQL